ncbi:Zinc finger CCCH domain-containing protein 17 [Dichanthelium oligosanthes]|uniref:Zinc finger CCCH domain-containing protein 17 n=1 Tax=Dichanthelium oligosanthes TaxID=888268 RepID=A0A1E5VG63_9POAL|nr:Zinc finger CCCH domain-containing protein 17 [Dichanthelium oligosanthes]
MPISSTLAARLGTGLAPAPARWGPYTRPSVPEPQGGRGGAKASRTPLRLDPATARLLGPAQKAALFRSGRRAEPAAADAASAAPARRSRGGEMTSPEPELNPKPASAGDNTLPPEKCRGSGGGGFVFLCALAGHTEAISGIALPLGSDKLYSGSVDGSVRVWDCNSGKVWDLMTLQCVQTLSEHKAAVTSVLRWDEKLLSCSLDKAVKAWTLSESGNLQVKNTHAEEHGLRTLFGMHRVGKTPVLFCSLHNSNCIRLLNLPWFEEVGTLFSKKEVRTIELADGGPLFTGDCSGELKVWRWAPQDQDQEAASAAYSWSLL